MKTAVFATGGLMSMLSGSNLLIILWTIIFSHKPETKDNLYAL